MSTGKNRFLTILGSRIRAKRQAQGLTQTDLCVHLDMNRGHLSDVENGKREVGLIMLQIIAKGLNTSMSELLKGL